MKSENFHSGQCFLSNAVVAAPMARKRPALTAVKTTPRSIKTVAKPPVDVRPRHDPSAPGALVMPRPDASHPLLADKQK